MPGYVQVIKLPIIPDESAGRCTIYSVRLLGGEEPQEPDIAETLFFRTLQALYNLKDDQVEEAIHELWAFLRRVARMGIRSRRGRKRTQWFRFENKASALPPPRRKQKGKLTHCEATGLRIYCLPLYESDALVLFSGGLKTTRTAQEDHALKRHFDLANKLADTVEQAWRDNRFDLASLEGELIPY